MFDRKRNWERWTSNTNTTALEKNEITVSDGENELQHNVLQYCSETELLHSSCLDTDTIFSSSENETLLSSENEEPLYLLNSSRGARSGSEPLYLRSRTPKRSSAPKLGYSNSPGIRGGYRAKKRWLERSRNTIVQKREVGTPNKAWLRSQGHVRCSTPM